MWFGLTIALVGALAQLYQVKQAHRVCGSLRQYDEELHELFATKAPTFPTEAPALLPADAKVLSEGPAPAEVENQGCPEVAI
jgi:hypothetical protein